MAPARFILLTILALSASAATAHAAPSTTGDFNGDNESDLAIGAPLDSVRGQDNAGAVNVIYGSERAGLREDPDQQFTQATRGVRGAADPDDRFGSTLAAGDFDGDGYGDLAVGAPSEDVSGVANAGVVHVLYGSDDGLTTRDELFGQGFAGVPGTREADQNFGAALAVGDFDGNGRADLAVGAPDDSVDGAQGAGAGNVLYATSGGLTAGGDQTWTQNTPGVKGLAAPFHNFGAALAAGDLDGDGEDDLAIGIPRGRIDGVAGAGAVTVLYESGGRLSERGDQLWSQGARGIKGAPEDSDTFGWSLAMGDFNQDRDMDLAVGVAHESLAGVEAAGAVQILYSADPGLRGADEMVHQAGRGMKGDLGRLDQFGAALTARDFDGDNEDDLAIGVPLEDVDGQSDAGAVSVVYGSERRGITGRDDLWHQNSSGIKGIAQASDNFGLTLASGDFDQDGRGDVAIATPRDSVAGFDEAGAVNVIYGDEEGLRQDADELWTQGTRGIKGAVGDDRFGQGLASGAG